MPGGAAGRDSPCFRPTPPPRLPTQLQDSLPGRLPEVLRGVHQGETLERVFPSLHPHGGNTCLEARDGFTERETSGGVKGRDWPGRENVVLGLPGASHVQVGLEAPPSVSARLALQDAGAERGPQRPVADHVPVRRGQAVKVVNVELPGNVAAEVFHLLRGRVAVGRRPVSSGAPPPAAGAKARAPTAGCSGTA